jgi:branched-chain amino acid transport system ATP-binding protein
VTAAEAVEAQPLGVVFANGGSQLAGQLGTTKNGLVTDLAQPLVPADDRALLSVRGLSVRYSNGSVALSGIDLDVQAGEIVAVLGRNGAGKTTLLRAIGGFLRSEHVTIAGDIRLAGVQVCGRTPTRTFRLGAVLVPEREKTFSKLTVEEHVQLVSPRGHTAEGLVFPQLAALWNSKAGLLSGGERQMLAMEMAWRSSPKLLLADEVSLGLAPVMVRTVLDRLVATVKERGVGAVIVEQDAVAALRVADRVYVVDRGGIRWSGPASGTSPAEIARTYLGGQE